MFLQGKILILAKKKNLKNTLYVYHYAKAKSMVSPILQLDHKRFFDEKCLYACLRLVKYRLVEPCMDIIS